MFSGFLVVLSGREEIPPTVLSSYRHKGGNKQYLYVYFILTPSLHSRVNIEEKEEEDATAEKKVTRVIKLGVCVWGFSFFFKLGGIENN